LPRDEVYTGPEGVLTGTARVVLESREAAEVEARRRTLEKLRAELEERERRHAREREDLERALARDLGAIREAIGEAEEGIDRRARMIARLAGMRSERRT
jgi:circadian clock protein KaiC